MKRDIAIIGMSARFPKSRNITELWQNLVGGRELIHFYSDEELLHKGVPSEKLKAENYVKAAPFIDGLNEFDYPFFNYTLEEAMVMSPQTRLMHQLVWEALEDSGCNSATYRKKIGIFVGANKDLNWSIYSAITKSENIDELTKSKMANPNFMGSLIAYKFNFTGPCYFMDTACSTSLSGAHLACRSLLFNECGLAVVAGIRALSYEDMGYDYHEGMIMSQDGHNRSFDKNASGTIGADGGGVVILKRLEEALLDNDRIYAVIKGSAMNNDGSTKAGYTMPSVEGQVECIRTAQKIAGVTPSDISYVEAHGTATKLGDPIEVESLNCAFNNDTSYKCAIGSIKSNMGHTDEAAGIAGLIKTALALHHRVIPASINYETPNPAINFQEGPFFVNSKTSVWHSINGKPLVAGINSLGIGGTNVHMIVHEAPVVEKKTISIHPKLIGFSAMNGKTLERYEANLLTFLQQNRTTDLADLAYTLQVGRKQFGLGKFVSARTVTELIEILQTGKVKPIALKEKSKVVFMFPGQGSQYVNMGMSLYEDFSSFRDDVNDAFSALERIQGVDYKAVLFNVKEISSINDTNFTQPILFVFEYALAKFLITLGIQPDYMIGHSLGEYVAATISGVFTLDDALKVVVKRALLMSKIDKGDMISVVMPLNEIDPNLLDGVSVAAVNSPGTFVLSGDRDGIHEVRQKFVVADISSIELKTSHAFHSKMMEPILLEFESVFSDVKLSTPTIPFVSNLSGDFISDEEATAPQYWTRHIRETVNFEKGIRKLITQNNSLFIEVGPGNALTTFYRHSQNLSFNNAVVGTVKHPKDSLDERVFFNNFLGTVWSNGIDIRWNAYYKDNQPHKISAPTYAFDGYDILAKVSVADMMKGHIGRKPEVKYISESFYVPSWKCVPLVGQSREAKQYNYVLFSDGSSFFGSLRDELVTGGNKVVVIHAGNKFEIHNERCITVNLSTDDDFQKVVEYLQTDFRIDRIIYGWDLTTSINLFTQYDALNGRLDQVLKIVRAFASGHDQSVARLMVLSNSDFSVSGKEIISGKSNHIGTLLRVLSQESPEIRTAAIDLDLPEHETENIMAVLDALSDVSHYLRVAYRNGRRWVPFFEPIQMDSQLKLCQIREKGNYIITGNQGELEFALIRYLLDSFQATVTLLTNGDTQGQNINALKQLPGRFQCLPCDISDNTMLSTAVESIEVSYGPIHGIVHAARFIDAKSITLVTQTTPKSMDIYFAPTVNGLLNIDTIFSSREIDFITVVSSISSFLGGISYGSYATSATLMEDIALHKRRTKTKWSVLNLDRISDEEKWIRPSELHRIFQTFFSAGPIEQIVVSKRDINAIDEVAANQTKITTRATINRAALTTPFEMPESETEAKVVTFFENLFGMKGVGVNDDFFELGGDSLKGMILINRLKKDIGIEITVSEMFSNKTVHELAMLIDEKKWLAEEATDSVNEILI